MAKLTPLAKGLITVIILGATGAAAWRLGLRNIVQEWGNDTPTPADGGGSDPSTPAKTPSDPKTTPKASTGAAGPLGTEGNPLKVSIVSFHGYAPGLLANGKSLKTAKDSI